MVSFTCILHFYESSFISNLIIEIMRTFFWQSPQYIPNLTLTASSLSRISCTCHRANYHHCTKILGEILYSHISARSPSFRLRSFLLCRRDLAEVSFISESFLSSCRDLCVILRFDERSLSSRGDVLKAR